MNLAVFERMEVFLQGQVPFYAPEIGLTVPVPSRNKKQGQSLLSFSKLFFGVDDVALDDADGFLNSFL